MTLSIRFRAAIVCTVVAVVAFGGTRAWPQDVDVPHTEALSDLTLLNFFSAGWSEDWAKRHRATGTPDFALLRSNELPRTRAPSQLLLREQRQQQDEEEHQ